MEPWPSFPPFLYFVVCLEDGTRVGSMASWTVPIPGDRVRVDDPDQQPLYEVVSRLIEPGDITVYVRPAGTGVPAVSEFARQAPGAGGFS